MMTSSTPFSLLPEDVLINIFEHLYGNKKQSNLINATLVSKKWNRIISQTHSLMDKLQLKLVSISFQTGVLLNIAALNNFKLTRFYRHVVWTNCWKNGTIPSTIFNEISTLDHLNTLEMAEWYPNNRELMENLQILSRCKFLRSLIFKYCCPTGKGRHKIERIEFKNLRKLKLIGSSSSILNCIKCKELESFNNESRDDNYSSDHYKVEFLNQLDRCDEISMDFGHSWTFNEFKPKFLNRLKLICRIGEYHYPNAAIISSIKSFLEASTTNAECEIEMSNFKSRNDTHNRLLLTILNSCRGITRLALNSSTLRSDLSQLRNLSEVRSLKIEADMLKAVEKFSYFISKLHNVTQLEIFSDYSKNFFGFHERNPNNARLVYQQFFNQITELTLKSKVVDSNSWPEPDLLENRHLMPNITCENLTLIRIIETSDFYRLRRPLNELFLRFCLENQNLRRMEIIRNIQYLGESGVCNSENEVLIRWYNQLQELATTIETCNVMVIQQINQTTPEMNWRVAEVDEIKLFGRKLTEDENRFFI